MRWRRRSANSYSAEEQSAGLLSHGFTRIDTDFRTSKYSLLIRVDLWLGRSGKVAAVLEHRTVESSRRDARE